MNPPGMTPLLNTKYPMALFKNVNGTAKQ